ncbi:SusC/RagA family TonB-linked outer membrane protein [Chitinophaga sp.]|uniref:SusC/RagA family TonB-linked outer membrane protein n=1 Tax=Chitinophaga sp. TaxID=1869181 RepID=UPI0031DB1148
MKSIFIFSFLIITHQLSAQLVNLDLHGQDLLDVSQILLAQTGFNFTIQPGITNARGPIYYKCSQIPLQRALKDMLNENIYSFSIKDNCVQIKYKEPVPGQVIDSIPAFDLAGMVVDATGAPLARATISLKRFNKAWSADNKGRFRIPDVTVKDTITISYIGYETRKFACNKRDFRQYMLQLTEQHLELFVSKGYYKVPRHANTGRISIISGHEIARQPVSDPLMALAGRATGVVVNQESGISGSAVDVSIQGLNSMANGNAPLYIVDGVPLAMATSIPNQLENAAGHLSTMQLPQPESIESIEILKDADASAIYGSKGANGVILIKTKRPSPGKTTLNISVYSGQGKITRGLKLMNTQQYLAMRREALSNDQQVPGMTDYDLTKWDTTRYTDWQKEFIGGHSNIMNASGSVSGGNEQTRFSLGGVYRRESALFSHAFASTTLSADLAVVHTSENKKANIDIGLHYLNNDNQLPISDITPKILIAPNAPALFTSTGELNWEDTTFQNPYGERRQRYQALFNHFLGSCKFSYELLPKLKLSTNIGYNYTQLDEDLVVPLNSMSPALSSFSLLRAHSQGVNAIQSWIVEPQANYSLQLKSIHSFDVLTGLTLQQSKQHQILNTGKDFQSDALVENISMAGVKDFTTDENLYRYYGIYARLGYNFNEEFYLNFTGRSDGSSRFSKERRTEYFGSAGVAWIFSKAPVFQRIPLLTFGKVHANIGRTGNDQFSDYQFYDTYTVSTGYGGVLGLERTQLTNYLYKWEILIKSSLGLELCFNNKYTIAANYSWNHTRNQLLKYNLPAVTGYKYTTENLPAVVQNHLLELELNIKQFQGVNFQWEHSFNLTVPNNKLISFPNISSSLYSSIYQVGQPLDIRFVYQFKGINPDNGIAEYKDLNGDHKIDIQDRSARYIGPAFYAGWGHTLTYKRFSLSLFLQLVRQSGYYVPSMDVPGNFVPSGGNQPLTDDTRWKKPGDIAQVQRYAANNQDAAHATVLLTQSDRSIVDASYIRLKNVSISHELPQLLCTRVKIKSASLFLNSQNLATWTHFKGMDPETQRYLINYRLPPQRVIVVGCRISL